jgi:RNA-directed DNA polymerase
VSPLLANIYLHELDMYMESKYLNLSRYEYSKRRKQGKGNYLYVRYADDFVVLCNGTKAEAHAMQEELRGLLCTMGLTLSEDKTKVTHITAGFDFLGYVRHEVAYTAVMTPKGGHNLVCCHQYPTQTCGWSNPAV